MGSQDRTKDAWQGGERCAHGSVKKGEAKEWRVK